MTPFARILVVGFCVTALAASLQLFVKEYKIAFLLRGTMNDQIDTLSQAGGLTFPVSARSTRDLLLACGRILTTAPRVKAEPQTAEAVRGACSVISGEILASAPGNGRAHAVAVLAKSPKISADDLRAAQEAAPYEPWPLVIRLDALASAPRIGADIAKAAESDILRALATPWGRDRVASLYTQHSELRDTIRRAAEQRPAADQQDFMRALRRTAREAN